MRLPVHPTMTSDNKIVITRSYREMYDRISDLRKALGSGGVVITGQPGIGVSLAEPTPCMATHRFIHRLGKSFFLNFVLARLISAEQVVVLSAEDTIFLFYGGTVYKRSPVHFSELPTCKRKERWPIWTLIDADGDCGPPINSWDNIWPIQVSSPHPTRWKGWRKQRGAAIFGMCLWDEEELMEGYVKAAFCHAPDCVFQ